MIIDHVPSACCPKSGISDFLSLQVSVDNPKRGKTLFSVIPAPHRVRGELQPESSQISWPKPFWTPAFAGVTA